MNLSFRGCRDQQEAEDRLRAFVRQCYVDRYFKDAKGPIPTSLIDEGIEAAIQQFRAGLASVRGSES